jgi:hypothetical protein
MHRPENSLALLVFVLYFLSAPLSAQEVFYDPNTFEQLSLSKGDMAIVPAEDFYAEERPVVVRLESDFTHLSLNREKEEYQPAVLHVQFSDEVAMRCEVRIRPRGKSRLKYCTTPPLKIDFTESGLQATSLRQLEKVKLVTRCREDYWFETYVLKEFLVYKMHNQITPLSYRARLAKILFVDTGNNGNQWENFGFILEETDAVGRREGLDEVEEPTHMVSKLNPDHALQLSMFQYMVGNTDWHLSIGHNLKYYKDPESEAKQLWAIPYDFDLTGMVKAVYAAPRGDLNQKNVKDRKFIGNKPTEDRLQKTILHFQNQKENLYRVVEEFEYLKSKDKKAMIKYLDDFFEILEDPEKIRQCFIEECIAYDW